MHTTGRTTSLLTARGIITFLGDGACIVLFAALGRAAHGEHGNPLIHALTVATPFLAGWYAAAAILRVYQASAVQPLRAVLGRVALAWLLGGVVGLAIRSVGEGHVVPLSFALIALSFVLVVLFIWRTVLSFLLPGR